MLTPDRRGHCLPVKTWVRQISERVRVLTQPVMGVAFSPHGALAALWRAPRLSGGTLGRGSVRVIEVAGGREVLALDDDEPVGAVIFVDDDRLLVLLELRPGALLQLRAIASGRVLAEARFPDLWPSRWQLQVSVAGQTLLVATDLMSGVPGRAECACYSLPDLALRRAILRPEESALGEGGEHTPGGTAALDAEGRRVAVYYPARGRGHVVIEGVLAPAVEPAVFEVALRPLNASLRWLAHDRLLVGSCVGRQGFVSVRLPAATAPGSHALPRGEWAEISRFEAFEESLDPDGARIVGWSPPDPKLAPREGLQVLDACRGVLLQTVPLERGARPPRAVGWADGTTLLEASGEGASVTVTARALDGEVRGATRLPPGRVHRGATLRVQALRGGEVILSARNHSGVAQCFFLGPMTR